MWALLLGAALLAQPDPKAPEQAVPNVVAEPSAAPTSVRLPAGTPLDVELVDSLSSNTNRMADRFVIRLVTPITQNGAVVVPAGATGEGEVIDAGRAGMGGKEGKLVISARYLDLNGRRVRVRGMSLLGSGTSRVNLATGVLLVPYVNLATPLIQGGEMVMPAGTRAVVKLAENVELPLVAATVIEGETK